VGRKTGDFLIGVKETLNVLLNVIFISVHIMSKRITIMIDDDLDKKLRIRQAKMIQQTQSSHSFSRTLNDILRKELTKK